MLHVVSCLLGCLPELSNDNNQQRATSYVLLHHDGFNILTNIDFIAFLGTQRRVSVQNSKSWLG